MKIRLMGLEDELAHVVNTLRIAFDVHEVSGFYPNRGDSKLGRVYVEAALASDEEASTPTGRPRRR